MPDTRRMANFELLRLLAMLMVVCLHYLPHAEALTDVRLPGSGVQLLGNFLEALCIAAVNLYVLITGYFLSASRFRFRRIFLLLAEILFYALLIPVCLSAIGIPLSGRGVWSAWFYLFPVSMESYWFITAYVILYLFAPLLNAGLDALTEKQLRALILCLLFFYSFLPSLSPVRLTSDRFGYDAGWFFVLYLTAGYIRRYGLPRLEDPRRAAVLYFGSAAGIWLLSVLLHHIAYVRGSLLYYAEVPFHYNFILCFTAALGLFAWFRLLRVPEGAAAALIRRAAPLTLGVYLIHENIDIRDRWTGALEKLFGPVPQGILLPLHMLGCVLVLYLCCLAADGIRSVLFSRVGRALSRTWAARALERLDGLFDRTEMSGRKRE
ncbi:acyltransferase [Lachnoclostridium sp. Marseille-P6806]|uniref:acyltransferase n=1 Tax=Lachnoclostridium sp. Marseille-P6806 TaxID=2364793 RepID=UPI0013EEFB09|nr:acyltransferase [Lachnoclostridium sp. Marseille-P6806]